jgi:DNA polymerase III subunit alpha
MVGAHALNVRSDFSIGESTLQIGTAVKIAKELGYDSVALVDTMSVNGLVDLWKAAKKEGIKPIIGCTLKVYENPKERTKGKENPYFTLKAYVLNEDGLKSLFALLTKANSEEYFYYNARVGFEDVLELDRQGIAISTGDFYNIFHHQDYRLKCDALAGTFDNFLIEFVPIATPLFDRLNERAAIVLANSPTAVPIITYPALYEKELDKSADVHRAITSNAKLSDQWLPIPYVRDFALSEPSKLIDRARRLIVQKILTKEQVKLAFLGVDSLIKVAEFEFKKHTPSLPKMGEDEFAGLCRKVKQGWAFRFAKPVLGHQPTSKELELQYKPRLKYELGIIEKMGFAGYFLLAASIVNWSKLQRIMVGPGRGSVGGSLIAYLIGITDVDPIRFNLLFERFINPDRIDLPDADLDFMSTRRHEVIEYIESTFGKECVAGISNYSMLGAASAVRDVSRVHGLDPFEYSCSKLMEKEHGVSVGLAESALRVPEVEKFARERPIIWEHALALEGCMRNFGRHAAGVVVAGEPIVNRAVVETRSGGSVVNWDKRTVEDWGLIKMDILGLSTLDILSMGYELVAKNHGVAIDYLDLPLDDGKVLKAFGEGDTAGIFQFESGGMKNLLKQLALGGTLSFEDLVAVTALFRPGPLDAGLCDDYIAIKQGAKVPYVDHPNMEAALKPTYSVIVYQEQVMQICRDVAGFTITEADHVRKAMGKKDKDMMASYREKFVAGAATESGMTEYQAGSLWDKIEVFAGYAFNRSHAVEYTVISWWAMWLKTYYPAEFFAAAMTVMAEAKEDKLEIMVTDARKRGLEILPPDINVSTDKVEIVGTKLYAPFQAVKGISEASARKIVELREDVPFSCKSSFERRVTEAKVGRFINSAARERLDKVGAFHSTDGGVEPLHADRLRDRLEFMPGFTVDAVKAERVLLFDKAAISKIVRIATDIRACDGCSLQGAAHPMPRMGKAPKFMVVFDCPTWQEEKADKMLEGDAATYLKAAIKDAGLAVADGYYTSLVKAPKPKGEKFLTNEQINGCSKWLSAEIDALKPPVILAMGANAIRFFSPGMKGNPADLAGKTVFDPKLDASVVFGINPQQIHFDGSKVALLQKIVAKAAELVASS